MWQIKVSLNGRTRDFIASQRASTWTDSRGYCIVCKSDFSACCSIQSNTAFISQCNPVSFESVSDQEWDQLRSALGELMEILERDPELRRYDVCEVSGRKYRKVSAPIQYWAEQC